MATTQDYKKFYYARGARDMRRMAAKVQSANADPELVAVFMRGLVELMATQRALALVAWPFPDDADEVEVDFSTYADGRPVFSTVDWDDGYATVVHHPDVLVATDPKALEPECWPCGHRPARPMGRLDLKASSGGRCNPAAPTGSRTLRARNQLPFQGRLVDPEVSAGPAVQKDAEPNRRSHSTSQDNSPTEANNRKEDPK